MEKLIDYMRTDLGYQEKDGILIRPDNSVAAVLKQERWKTLPTPEEMAGFSFYCNRGIPSLYRKDLTNPGHG